MSSIVNIIEFMLLLASISVCHLRMVQLLEQSMAM